MLNTNDKILPETVIKLQSFARPPLSAGDYTLKSQLFIKGTGDESVVPDNISFTNDGLKFTVAAPRFALDSSLIYSLYPLPGSTGAYHATLPHIIFTRKTLPWERVIGDATDTRPWMGLLLLTEEEIKTQLITITEIPVDNVTVVPADNANLIVPAIKLDEWEKNGSKIKVLEMPLSFFRSIAPLPDELDYLAHTRQVDTSNKENSDINPKGWFSSLITNRLPQKNVANTVFLVSLEGHSFTLKPDAAAADTGKNVRLVLLHQWSFIEQGATFEELVEKLASNTKSLRIDMDDLINTNDPTGAQKLNTSIAPIAKKAFQYGYFPMNHDRRNGSKSVSWYRGPLVPVFIAQPQQYQYDNADQALRFDETSGMFDISYATAWQLGRLLALQSPGFFTALNNWKTSFKRERPLNIAKEILKNEPGIQINPEDLAAVIHSAESEEVLTDYLFEIWNANQQ